MEESVETKVKSHPRGLGVISTSDLDLEAVQDTLSGGTTELKQMWGVGVETPT